MKWHEIMSSGRCFPLAWLVHHGSTGHHSNSRPGDKGLPLSGHSSPLLSSPQLNSSTQLNSIRAMPIQIKVEANKALLNNTTVLKLNPELYSAYKKNFIPLDVIT